MLYPSFRVISDLAGSCHRLADAIGNYQRTLAGKPLRELDSPLAKSAWLSLVDAFHRVCEIRADGGSLLAPGGDDETEGWEHSIDLSEALGNGQRLMGILEDRLRDALPCGSDLTNTVVRWFAKPTRGKQANNTRQLLAWWAAPDWFDEFAREIRQSKRGLNSISWNEARRQIAENPDVTVAELQALADQITCDRQREHGDNLIQDTYAAKFLLRVEQRRELLDPSALFPEEGDYWEHFDCFLAESFEWPILDDSSSGPDDSEVREYFSSLFIDAFDLWLEGEIEPHLARTPPPETEIEPHLARTPPSENEGEGHTTERRTRKKRGRKIDTDVKEDKRIFEAWRTGRYTTKGDLGRELRKTEGQVRTAIDRHRHRASGQTLGLEEMP